MPKKTILDLVADYEIELTEEGELLRAYCPFHNDTGRPNFTVYEATDSWYCFACKEGGDAVSFVAKMEGLSYSDAKKKLAGKTVDLEELRERIDGIGLTEEKTPLNDEVNILLSKMIRKMLKDRPDKFEEIITFSEKMDQKLLTPVYYNEMKNLLNEVYIFEKKVYN